MWQNTLKLSNKPSVLLSVVNKGKPELTSRRNMRNSTTVPQQRSKLQDYLTNTQYLQEYF